MKQVKTVFYAFLMSFICFTMSGCTININETGPASQNSENTSDPEYIEEGVDTDVKQIQP